MEVDESILFRFPLFSDRHEELHHEELHHEELHHEDPQSHGEDQDRNHHHCRLTTNRSNRANDYRKSGASATMMIQE